MLRQTFKMTCLTFAILLVASCVEARANSYLFRLTDEEINEVMNRYYPRGYDRDAVLRQMSEPFDCENFGDLCSEVGRDYAYRVVESVWSKARMGFPIEMIYRSAEGEIDNFTIRYLEETYPLGISDKDPFWGEERSASSSNSCSPSLSATSGDFRILTQSKRRNFAVTVWGRVKVDHFKKNLFGNFKLEKADRLEVEGTVFLKVAGFDVTEHAIADVKYDAKGMAASYAYGGLTVASVPFVEGCGGVGPNSILWACTCSGTLPSIP